MSKSYTDGEHPARPTTDGFGGLTKREYMALEILKAIYSTGTASDAAPEAAVKRADQLICELRKERR